MVIQGVYTLLSHLFISLGVAYLIYNTAQKENTGLNEAAKTLALGLVVVAILGAFNGAGKIVQQSHSECSPQRSAIMKK
jgi:hypothetical protein